MSSLPPRMTSMGRKVARPASRRLQELYGPAAVVLRVHDDVLYRCAQRRLNGERAAPVGADQLRHCAVYALERPALCLRA